MFRTMKEGFITGSFLLTQIFIISALLIIYQLICQRTELLVQSLYACAERSALRSIIRITQRQAELLGTKERGGTTILTPLNAHIICSETKCCAYRNKIQLFICKRKQCFKLKKNI